MCPADKRLGWDNELSSGQLTGQLHGGKQNLEKPPPRTTMQQPAVVTPWCAHYEWVCQRQKEINWVTHSILRPVCPEVLKLFLLLNLWQNVLFTSHGLPYVFHLSVLPVRGWEPQRGWHHRPRLGHQVRAQTQVLMGRSPSGTKPVVYKK